MPANRTIQTERGPIEYAEVGRGPPIVYFHGTGGGYEVVFPMEQALLAAGFRMIVPNRPGYYGTSLARRTTAAARAQLAVAVVDDLGVSKVAVIGTSGGGPAALSFAALYPDRTTALVLQCAQTQALRKIRRVLAPRRDRRAAIKAHTT